MSITEQAQPGDGEGGAKKLDAKKVPFFKGLIGYFPRALKQVALVSRYGAHKYDWNGWEAVPNGEERYMDGLARHINAISEEGQFDITDSNLPHLAQVAWNALAVLELKMRSGEIPLTAIDYDGEVVGHGNTLKEGNPFVDEAKVAMPDFYDRVRDIVYWANKERLESTIQELGMSTKAADSVNHPGYWMMKSYAEERKFRSKYPEVINAMPERPLERVDTEKGNQLIVPHPDFCEGNRIYWHSKQRALEMLKTLGANPNDLSKSSNFKGTWFVGRWAQRLYQEKYPAYYDRLSDAVRPARRN